MAKAKINPAYSYKTRDGQEVTDIEVGQPTTSDPYCVAAKIEGSREYFTCQGHYYKGEIHRLDLIKQPAKNTKPKKETEVVTRNTKDTPEVLPQDIQAVPHKHHDLIVAWAKNPNLKIQFKYKSCDVWTDFCNKRNILDWDVEYDYRIKPEEPKLLTIIGSDGKARSYPEPCRVKPGEGATYFVPATSYINSYHDQFTWRNDEYDKRFMKWGIHLTKEAAELHAKAMLGLD